MYDIDHVCEAIRSEREYQRRLWGTRQPDSSLKENNHSVGDFILYMQRYMSETIAAATTIPGG